MEVHIKNRLYQLVATVTHMQFVLMIVDSEFVISHYEQPF